MRKLTIAAAIAAAALGGTAQAAITVYTSLAAFTAATTAAGTDTFNNLAPGAPLAASLTRSAGSYSYRVSDSVSTLYGAGTAADAWLSNGTNDATITFNTFAPGISAAGANFFGSDFNGLFVAAPLGLTVTATDASGTVTQSLISPTQTTFLGFVSTGTLTSLTVKATVSNQSYWATANNLVLAQASAVPEPTSWALMIGGFGLVGGMMRRRVSTVAFAA